MVHGGDTVTVED